MPEIDMARMRADAGEVEAMEDALSLYELGKKLAHHVLALCDRVEALEAQLAEHQRLTTEAESETAE